MLEGGARLRGSVKSPRGEAPLVSIVTVVRNAGTEIDATIRSVLGQSYSNIEYIVIDGGSTDGTVEVIKRFENDIDYWRSEADSGIYEAMNKGLAHANGALIGMINATDAYEENIIESIVREHRMAPTAILYGPVMFYETNGKSYIWGCPVDRLVERMMVPHASVFVPKAVYEKHKYDEGLRIVGDFEFLLSRYLAGDEFRLLRQVVARVKRGGVSDADKDAVDRELHLVSDKLGANLFPDGDRAAKHGGDRRGSPPKQLLRLLWHCVLRVRDVVKAMP